jgi:hypothetical protein
MQPTLSQIAYTLEVLRAEVLKIEEIAFYAEKELDRFDHHFLPASSARSIDSAIAL